MSSWVGQKGYSETRTSHPPACPNCHGRGRWWNSVYEDYQPCFFDWKGAVAAESKPDGNDGE